MIDYETPRFKSSEVAAVCNMTPVTFRSYFTRGIWRVIGDMQRADGSGLPHLFSLRDTLGFAVAARLAKCGVDPRAAWNIAMLEFAHAGDEDRDPAAMFITERGETILLYWPFSQEARLVASKDADCPTFTDLMSAGEQHYALTALALNPIEEEVFDRLGVAEQ